MSDYWDVYMCLAEDKPASIVLDMAANENVDVNQFPYLYGIRIHLKRPNDEGFGITEEMDRIADMEEAYLDQFLSDSICHVGRMMTNGTIENYFYCATLSDQYFKQVAADFIEPAGYKAEIVHIEEEKNWEYYFDYLYPNVYEQQHMGNAHIVDTLLEQGDPLTEKRPISHLFLFENKRNIKNFIEEIQSNGFKIESKSFFKKDGFYELTAARTDSVEFNAVNELTDWLIDLAMKYHADYDGWETVVLSTNV